MNHRYLLDTNILLRAADPASSRHHQAVEAVASLLETGWDCVVTAQVLIEFWVVATRPLEVNGLGWTVEHTNSEIGSVLNEFLLLEDSPAIFPLWIDYVTTHQIKGKRVHDVRLQAVMKVHQVTHLLTFNSGDFIPLEGMVIVDPSQVILR
ncbi:MAG: PIN domain-containing protein [Cyanobacteriota bacterium]|nr:PIN domain-containing protein [Cyanobacteriota bacterium]